MDNKAKYASKYAFKLVERETTITLNGEDVNASFYTSDLCTIRKMEALMQKHPEVTVRKRDVHSITLYVPKKWVKIRPPRQVSEMQKEVSRKKMENLWEARKEIKGSVQST